MSRHQAVIQNYIMQENLINGIKGCKEMVKKKNYFLTTPNKNGAECCHYHQLRLHLINA
jgi:hypothetical protein